MAGWAEAEVSAMRLRRPILVVSTFVIRMRAAGESICTVVGGVREFNDGAQQRFYNGMMVICMPVS